MTETWCKLTYNLIPVTTCDATLWPALITGVLIGILATSVVVGVVNYYWK
jgi:hypothetical protein